MAEALRVRWGLLGALAEAARCYSDGHPHACYAHRESWQRAVWRCYRIPTLPLVATRNEQVVGVAPFSILMNPFAGPYAVIGPFASYADLLADDDEVASALVQRAASALRRFGVHHLQLRGVHRLPATGSLLARASTDRFICPRVDIRVGSEPLWNALEVRARNAVRKARKVGVQVSAVEDDMRAFMRVIDAGNRRLGSPFHGQHYFEALHGGFGGALRLWIATVRGEPAAVAVSLIDRGGLYYLYGQNVAELRSTAANALLVWHMIEYACERGLEYVDLGRSEVDSSHQRFKRQWAAHDVAMYELVVAARGRTLPDLSPTNPKLAFAQQTWSRLPLSVTKRLGPLLIRGFG